MGNNRRGNNWLRKLHGTNDDISLNDAFLNRVRSRIHSKYLGNDLSIGGAQGTVVKSGLHCWGRCRSNIEVDQHCYQALSPPHLPEKANFQIDIEENAISLRCGFVTIHLT